ncbi:hypothetical protein [Nostoc punctiforme]|jgi:hypothetical protein|uniref:Uncharacterized protein n=1 Tax=Nostoc punctiforme (strain ATCC 29133 / PCC 73102) TaxID=63737 RepID=B2IY08_NOSP7|nr:hypothetical protein [Nostoc punctiforme]ACC83067.1 hypothetical protein Npun_R4712 [Nostoc punctiforme PCC 73102]
MLTDTQEGRKLINEVAYRIVSEKAPKERPLYVGIRDKYFANPEKFSQESSEAIDEPLGMGEIAILGTLTQVVFPIITPILEYLIVEVAQGMAKKTGEEIFQEASQWLRSLFSEPKPKPLFSQEQLEEIAKTIQKITEDKVNTQNIENIEWVKVTTVTDSVITRLALAKK